MTVSGDKETGRRALAAEGALLLLIECLSMRGSISVEEGEEMIRLISSSSELSASRSSHLLHTMSQLRRLRAGSGSDVPGAPQGLPGLDS